MRPPKPLKVEISRKAIKQRVPIIGEVGTAFEAFAHPTINYKYLLSPRSRNKYTAASPPGLAARPAR